MTTKNENINNVGLGRAAVTISLLFASGYSFSGRDLSNLDLTNANFRNACFLLQNLKKTNLNQVDVRYKQGQVYRIEYQ